MYLGQLAQLHLLNGPGSLFQLNFPFELHVGLIDSHQYRKYIRQVLVWALILASKALLVQCYLPSTFLR